MSDTVGAVAETVDDYIEAFPPKARTALEGVRAAVLRAAPDAAEKISYAMPTYTVGGRRLIYFAGWKKHVALYAIPQLGAEIELDLAPYRTQKDTVNFPLAQPIPFDLVERVTAALLALRG